MKQEHIELIEGHIEELDDLVADRKSDAEDYTERIGEGASGIVAVLTKEINELEAEVAKWRGLLKAAGSSGRTPDEAAYVRAAGERYGRDGECEVDDDAVVSMGMDDGAYVQAWVWVEAEDMRKARRAMKRESREGGKGETL